MGDAVRVEPVTALFAEKDRELCRAIRLYAAQQDAVQECSVVQTGRRVLEELERGLHPDVLMLDALLPDTSIYTLLRRVNQMTLGYRPHIVVSLVPSAASQIEKLLTLGTDCTIFKPYELPSLFDTIYQTAAQGHRLEVYLARECLYEQLAALHYHGHAFGLNYLEQVIYLNIFTQRPYALGELCAMTADLFQTNAGAVHAALERLNRTLYDVGQPAYDSLCLQKGKAPGSRLTVSELIEVLTARVRHSLRR